MFLRGCGGMKPEGVERNAQEVLEDRELVLAKRPNPKKRIGEVSCNKEDLLLQRL